MSLVGIPIHFHWPISIFTSVALGFGVMVNFAQCNIASVTAYVALVEFRSPSEDRMHTSDSSKCSTAIKSLALILHIPDQL